MLAFPEFGGKGECQENRPDPQCFEKVSPATGVNAIMDGSTGDGTPIANKFLSPLFSRDFFVILRNKEI